MFQFTAHHWKKASNHSTKGEKSNFYQLFLNKTILVRTIISNSADLVTKDSLAEEQSEKASHFGDSQISTVGWDIFQTEEQYILECEVVLEWSKDNIF